VKIFLLLFALLPSAGSAQEPSFPQRSPIEITVLFPASATDDGEIVDFPVLN